MRPPFMETIQESDLSVMYLGHPHSKNTNKPNKELSLHNSVLKNWMNKALYLIEWEVMKEEDAP